MEIKSDAFDLYLIIGLTKESRHWSEDFLNEIHSQLKPNKIHLVDLPGSGKFLHSKSPTTLASIVDQTREQLEFHPDRKRVVVAISLGGMVAWEWVTRYPNDFDAMVMINSSMAGVSSVFRRVQPKAILSFLQIALAKKGEKKEKLILDLCSNHESNAKKIHPKWAKIGIEGDMRLSNVLRQLVAGMRFRPKAIPRLPLLLIASKYDRLAHYSCSQDIARLTKAQLVLCEDQSIGHAFHLDGPQFLVSEISGWLEGISL